MKQLYVYRWIGGASGEVPCPAHDYEILRAAAEVLRGRGRRRAGTVGEIQLCGLADLLDSEAARLEADAGGRNGT